VIEDAPAGIRAAHAGGMKVIALTSSYAPSVVSEADVVVQKLDQIKVMPNGARKLTISVNSTP
jgi:beta-phosphoglucomutase-like phosphatase (HAD superfamily)